MAFVQICTIEMLHRVDNRANKFLWLVEPYSFLKMIQMNGFSFLNKQTNLVGLRRIHYVLQANFVDATEKGT